MLNRALRAVLTSTCASHLCRTTVRTSQSQFHTSVHCRSDRNEKAIRVLQKEAEPQPLTAPDAQEEPEVYNIAAAALFPTQNMENVLVAGQPFGIIPVAHIKAGYNNTIISITDHTGKTVYSLKSGGTEGFRNARKRTDIAAQSAGSSAGQEAMKKGLTHVRALVKGIGPGRLPCIKGLKLSGIEVVSLTDITPVPFNGPKPQKRRRL